MSAERAGPCAAVRRGGGGERKSGRYSVRLICTLLMPLCASICYAATSTAGGESLSFLGDRNLQRSPGFETAFCAQFLDDLRKSSTRITIVPPRIESNDFDDPRMRQALEGCEKEELTTFREEVPRHSRWGRTLADTGRVFRSTDVYALYELQLEDTPVYKKDLLLYVGPLYIETYDEQTEQTVNRLTYGGTFLEFTQPGCEVVRTLGEGVWPGRVTTLRRLSEIVHYDGAYYAVLVGSIGGLPGSYIAVKELGGAGKVNSVCSFYEKE